MGQNWCKKDKWINRKRQPRNIPKYSPTDLQQIAKAVKWRKHCAFQQLVQEQLNIHVQKKTMKNLDMDLIPFTNIKMDHIPKFKTQNYKAEKNLHALEFGDDFLNTTPKT